LSQLIQFSEEKSSKKESGHTQEGGVILSPLQDRQLLIEVSQVAQLLLQLRQFSEEKSSKKESGQTQDGGVILSPLQIKQFEEEVTHVEHLLSQF
jgi:hypothetical protein